MYFGLVSEPNTSGCRCYGLAVGCLLVLVVLLLAAIPVLWVKLTTKRDQIQSSFDNITTLKTQSEISYTNLTAEKEQLEKKVFEERDELQRTLSKLSR